MKLHFIFDLDGTLAKSKSTVEQPIAKMFHSILNSYYQRTIVIISGGQFKQFQDQLIKPLKASLWPSDWKRIHIFPTCGTSYYKFNNDTWDKVYEELIPECDRAKIINAIREAEAAAGYQPSEVWGEPIEDRGTQITYSALGQEAPYEVKKIWDPSTGKRQRIKSLLQPMIPDYDINFGGTTSLDITKRGINKSFAIRKIQSLFPAQLDELIFFGDALEPGGNDYPVFEYGVDSIPVNSPVDTIWKVKLALSW